MGVLVLALLATFIPGSSAFRLKASGAMALERRDMEQGLYGSKAWCSTHAVYVGMECEGSTMQIEMGGSTINSVYKESPKACGALCETTEGCVAWSWNNDSETCCVQNSCKRRVPNSNMVSGMKASYRGMWYYKNKSDVADFDIDIFYSMWIDVDQKGEMTLQKVDAQGEVHLNGELEMASGSRHGAQQRGDELEVRFQETDGTIFGTMRVRLTDGKIKLWLWLPGENDPHEMMAEKKEVVFEPFQRVTIKEDQVIAASDVQFWIGALAPGTQPFPLKRGNGGTVVNSRHPRKTGVIFDQDQDKVVWVSDALLVESTLLEKVSDEEVKDVLDRLGDDLVLAIRDPITKQILRDPVKALYYTYERHSIEEAWGAQVDFKTIFTPDFTIRSLVSSVIQKVNAARVAKPTLSEEVSEEEVKDVLKNLGDDLIVAISDPMTFEILRDPVKAADGFTYERRSIEEWIWQAQVEFRTPRNHFGSPLSSVKLTPDLSIRSLVSSVITKVRTARAARSKIQKHWRGFQVRKGTSQLEAKLAWLEREMKNHRRHLPEHQQKLSALEKRHAEIITALSGDAPPAKAE